MSVLYVCRTDPTQVGGVAEVARQWMKHFPEEQALVRPDLDDTTVISFLKTARDPPDLVHLWAGQFPLATLYARCLGLPIILDRSSTHAMWQRNVLGQEAERLEEARIAYAKGAVPDIRHVLAEMAEYDHTHVVVPCGFAEQTFYEVAGSYGNPERLSVVPTGVDIERFQPTERSGTVVDDQVAALFSGHNWFRKGLVYLYMAAHELDPKRFYFNFNIGAERQPPFKLPYLTRMPHAFTNYPTGLHDVYPTVDVAVLPTLEDALPLSLDEAMAAGLPVITTPNAGSRVVDGKSGFIVPIRDHRAIADKLLYFADNPSELLRMGKEARLEAEQWPWSRYATRLRKVYKEATA